MAVLCAVLLLAGCQTTSQEQAMLGNLMGSVAGGLVSGLASSGRVSPAAAAAMTGAAAMGSAALAASAAPAPSAAAGDITQGNRSYAGRSIMFGDMPVPDTPACRQMIAYAKPGYGDRDARHFTRLYNACLASAPNHPTSRRFACAPGKYRMQYGYPPRPICGPA